MTCLKIYFKPVTSSRFCRNDAQNKKFKQVRAAAASQPANICWKKKREQIKGSAVQMLVVLIPGTRALPSATHTGRPGIQNRLSQYHFINFLIWGVVGGNSPNI